MAALSLCAKAGRRGEQTQCGPVTAAETSHCKVASAGNEVAAARAAPPPEFQRAAWPRWPVCRWRRRQNGSAANRTVLHGAGRARKRNRRRPRTHRQRSAAACGTGSGGAGAAVGCWFARSGNASLSKRRREGGPLGPSGPFQPQTGQSGLSEPFLATWHGSDTHNNNCVH